MIDESKLERLMELKQQREKIEIEITTLMGGEIPKRKWTRRITEADNQEKAPA